MSAKRIKRGFTTPRARQPSLILSHPDGNLEVFSDTNIDYHFARVPVAFDQDRECMSEEVSAMLLPVRYRDLWRADRLRLVGSTRPLLPSVLCDARFNQAMLDTCNRFGHMAAPVEGLNEITLSEDGA